MLTQFTFFFFFRCHFIPVLMLILLWDKCIFQYTVYVQLYCVMTTEWPSVCVCVLEHQAAIWATATFTICHIPLPYCTPLLYTACSYAHYIPSVLLLPFYKQIPLSSNHPILLLLTVALLVPISTSTEHLCYLIAISWPCFLWSYLFFWYQCIY